MVLMHLVLLVVQVVLVAVQQVAVAVQALAAQAAQEYFTSSIKRIKQ
jgi:hypothetical protein